MDFMFGLAQPGKELEQIKQAGINWLRIDIPWPFENGGASHSDKFLKAARKIDAYNKMGFEVMGITPHPGFSARYMQGTTAYYDEYKEGCRYIASYFGGKIKIWQIGNEPNLKPFRQGLTPEQMCDFMLSGLQGIKEGAGSALTGINPSYDDDAMWGILDRMYKKSEIEPDYAGIDSYPGSWEAGGPGTWKDRLDKIYSFVQKPIIVAEFGYSSKGDILTEEEILRREDAGEAEALLKQMGFYDESLARDKESYEKGMMLYKLHRYKKWGHCWKAGHTEKEQAQYLKEAFELFVAHPNVIGAFWFKGTDSTSCFWCKQDGCPCETAWGLFDTAGKAKESYFSFKKVISQYRSGK